MREEGVVEDETAVREGLRTQFSHLGYTVVCAANGAEALELLQGNTNPDLIMLDLGLPDMDGTRLLDWLQQRPLPIPVLVLSARTHESDIVLSFKLGSYDYVTKPFSPRVLAARVESLINRGTHVPSQTFVLGDLTIDLEAYSVQSPRREVHLTTKEFDIMRALFENAGKPVTRHDLLDEVWGLDSDAGPRTVDTHIAALRKKIEPTPDQPRFIISQRGIGYKLVVSS